MVSWPNDSEFTGPTFSQDGRSRPPDRHRGDRRPEHADARHAGVLPVRVQGAEGAGQELPGDEQPCTADAQPSMQVSQPLARPGLDGAPAAAPDR